jgi:hypothetical protein
VPTKTSFHAASEPRVVMNLAAQVGIRNPLPEVSVLLEREKRLDRLQMEARREAGERRAAAKAELLASDEVTREMVDRCVDVLRETNPWLDHTLYSAHPMASPAMDLLGEVREGLNSNAQQTLYQVGFVLYSQLAEVAAAQVAAVERLAPLPANAWANPNPSNVVLGAGRDADWMVILRANQQFQLCWSAGWLLRRESLGAEAVLPGGRPREAFTFKDWQAATAGMPDLRRLDEDLRLVRAIDAGWGPGLWSASDYREPTRSGLLAKLRG